MSGECGREKLPATRPYARLQPVATAVEVELDLAAYDGWTRELIDALSTAVGLDATEEVYLWYDGDCADSRRLTEKNGWKVVNRLNAEDVLAVAPPLAHRSASVEPWRDPANSKLRWFQATAIVLDVIPVCKLW